MAEPSRVDPANTFVVRLWSEWSAGGLRWRGRVDHVQSGDSAAFLDVDGLLAFIRRFTPLEDDKHQATTEHR